LQFAIEINGGFAAGKGQIRWAVFDDRDKCHGKSAMRKDALRHPSHKVFNPI